MRRRPRAPVDPLQHVVAAGPYPYFPPSYWLEVLRGRGFDAYAERHAEQAGLGA
jgi:hypothetical protein